MQVGLVLAGLLALNFSNPVTTGSALSAAIVVIAAGIFALKNRKNAGWKDLYEIERARAEQLMDAKEDERVKKHNALNEIAAIRGQLEVERAKPNLGGLMEQATLQHTESMLVLREIASAVNGSSGKESKLAGQA